MGRLDKLMNLGRLVHRIRELEQQAPGSALSELRNLLQDPDRSREFIAFLLPALRGFGPAATVVIPLLEKLSRPGETERVRQVAGSILAAIRREPRR